MKFSLIVVLAGLLNISLINSCEMARSINCVRTGCSGEICADDEFASICIFRPEFECYREAVCERQADGKCGWTHTEASQKCLDGTKNGAALQ